MARKSAGRSMSGSTNIGAPPLVKWFERACKIGGATRRPVVRLGIDINLESRDLPGSLLALGAGLSDNLALPQLDQELLAPEGRTAGRAYSTPHESDLHDRVEGIVPWFITLTPPPQRAPSASQEPAATDKTSLSAPTGNTDRRELLASSFPDLFETPGSAKKLSQLLSTDLSQAGAISSHTGGSLTTGGQISPSSSVGTREVVTAPATPNGASAHDPLPFSFAPPGLTPRPLGVTRHPFVPASDGGSGGTGYSDGGSQTLVISEVFGGGNSGGPFNRDFIELFNRGDVPVDLSGWSVQYAAPGSGVWLVTPLAGTVAPGQYFLIGGAGGGPGAPLPPPDVVGSIDLSAFGGKVALVRNPVPLTDPDPDLFAVIDLVGYGPADFFEGPGPAPPLAPAISDQRLNGGFVDTNNNAVDFVPGTPTPQNSDAFHPSHVNLPPTIEAPAYQITPQDTAVVFSNVNFNPIFIDDVDAANRPVQVSLSVTSGLLSVGGTEDASITFIGTLDAINIALDGLRFTPAVGFTGNVPLTITADDLGNSGSGGPRVVQAQVPISVGRAVLVQAIDAAAFEEGQDPARFTLTRTGDTSTPLTVSYTVGGTATFGSGPGGDYTLSLSGSPLPSSGSITIPAGLSEVTIDVLPIDDVVLENEETVQFTVLNGATYVVAANGQAEGKINDKSFGLDKTKKAEANNHEAAHALATGAGIKVGVVDTSLKDVKGIVEKKAHLGSRLKLNQDLTGLKPLEVVDAMNPNPEGRAIPQDKANHEHSTLVADVIASGDDRFTGVAKGAEVYAAFVDGVDSTRLAIDYLYGRQQVALFNLSFVDISSPGLESFVDWFTITRDVLFVSAAGNRSFSEYITSPAIAFDGITVGAVGADFKTRGPYSNWRTSLEADGTDPSTSKDVRGLPHVLAPGGEQGKHITNGTISLRGTSFAAPHVTGIAALLAQRQARNMDLPLGTAGQSNHLAYKAIILNSARKRYINAPKNDHPNALDNDATKDQPSDFNYLKVVDGKPALNDVADPAKTADWTPANWSLANIDGRTYKKLVVTSPLDDEQGTGVADAERALIQYNGGTGTENSGKKAPGNVGRIGWNIDKLRLGEGGAAATHEYNLNFAVQKGAMITVTLAWDRLLDETESNGLAGDGRVELKDVYNSPNDGPRGSKGMTDFNLKILHNGVPVAESVAPVGNQDKGDVVEHLHFPAPEDGNAGAYKIVVELKQHGAGANKDYTYALAWWA